MLGDGLGAGLGDFFAAGEPVGVRATSDNTTNKDATLVRFMRAL